jgi:hypothetical protein
VVGNVRGSRPVVVAAVVKAVDRRAAVRRQTSRVERGGDVVMRDHQQTVCARWRSL